MGTALTVLTLHGGGGGLASLELRQRGGGVGIKLIFVICHVKMSKLHKIRPYSARYGRGSFSEKSTFMKWSKVYLFFKFPAKLSFFNQTTKQVNYYDFCNE